MTNKHTPENIKQEFYNKYSNTSNYKELGIKNNKITTDLKNIFNNNIWNLKDQAQELEKKQLIEHNNFYNGFLSNVYYWIITNNQKLKQSQLKILMIINLMKVKHRGTN